MPTGYLRSGPQHQRGVTGRQRADRIQLPDCTISGYRISCGSDGHGGGVTAREKGIGSREPCTLFPIHGFLRRRDNELTPRLWDGIGVVVCHSLEHGRASGYDLLHSLLRSDAP
jgi:hypothetical protein